MATVSEHTDELDGQPLFWRTAPSTTRRGARPVRPRRPDEQRRLGARSSSGPAASRPTCPGFGRTGKRGDGDFTMEGYERFIERFLEHAGVERVRLLVHDWGAVGLLWAMRNPERVERLVVMNAVPFLPGYRWHRTARMWRTRVLGETLMGAVNRTTLRICAARGARRPRADARAFVDEVIAHFDPGTQRAILRLYRTSPRGRSSPRRAPTSAA